MSPRHFTKEEVAILVQVFDKDPHPSRKTKQDLAAMFNVPCKKVQVWFQNRRSKERKNRLAQELVDNGEEDNGILDTGEEEEQDPKNGADHVEESYIRDDYRGCCRTHSFSCTVKVEMQMKCSS